MGNISQKKKEINESPANKPPADEPPADEPPAKNLGEYERGKGKIIIIVNDEFKECDLISLPGSKKDIDVICDLFPKEKHDVVLLRNRTKEELLKELDEEIKKINGSEKDSYEFMAMFFSSHGGCQSANVQFKSSSGNATKVNAADINATDKKTTEVSIEYLFDTAGDRMFFFEDFVAKFNTSDDCCPRLKGKPKLFVFDNCRGSKENSLMRKAEEASTSEYRGKGPSIACQYPEVGEYMIFHATVKGAASYQYTNDGSFLITCEFW